VESAPRRRTVCALALAFLAAEAFLLRLPTLHQPLDRDLAAYATIGALMRDGFVPYRDVFDHKQPLVYAMYGAIEATFSSPRNVGTPSSSRTAFASCASCALRNVVSVTSGMRRGL